MDPNLAIRAGVTQLVTVAALSIALALALPHSFFELWGWVAGPASWFACALLTAAVLGLPRRRVLLGAALAGMLSGGAVAIGIHWLGVAIAIGAFAAWCGRIEAGGGDPAWNSA